MFLLTANAKVVLLMKLLVLLVAICVLAVFLSPKEQRQKNGVIAIAICALLGGGYFFILNEQKDTTQVSELSIDGISLGISFDEVQKILGKAQGTREGDKVTYYDYDGLAIAIEDGKVTGLYTDNPSRKTKQGIHAGSSYADMVKVYGQDYEESQDDNDITYVYTISDDNGNSGIFMFVINASDKNKQIKDIYCFTANDKEESKDETAEGAELSLGGAELGMDVDSMRKVLGTENTTKDSNGGTMYDYDTITVFVKNNKIMAIHSVDSHVKTKRGIHARASYDDMIQAYGNDYTETEGSEDRTVYMYSFTENNKKGALFFYIKNSDKTIGQIICMYVNDNKKKQSEQTSQNSSQSNSSGTAADNNGDSAIVNAAYQVLAGYHQAITRGELNTAWSYLTDDQKENMGGYQNFKQGYSTTLSSQLQNVEVKEMSATQVIFSYDIVARDRISNGVKVQNFSGAAVMKAENGKWKISYTTAKKTGEHME